MPHNFADIEVLRQGDAQGNGMVLKLTTGQGLTIQAVAVPREGFSYTGPTWAYLFENEGLTLIDSGVTGSFSKLAEGVQYTGYRVEDIQRVIITHGHEDHDGAVAQLVAETGAEVWAHDIYAHLQPYDPRDIERRAISPLQEEMHRVAQVNDVVFRSSPERESYLQRRKELKLDHRIQSGERLGNLTFLHAPGHSPDEICVNLDGVVFTGDHVLPEITPHPTTKTRFAPEVKQHLPEKYHNEDGWYGLETYLRSLQKVAELGPNVAVLPAHRLFNRSKFNFLSVTRAGDLIQHHAQRLSAIMASLRPETLSLEQLTRGIFERRKLEGGNLFAALSEMVAHIELLQDAGDLEVSDDGQLNPTGAQNYQQLINELTTLSPPSSC